MRKLETGRSGKMWLRKQTFNGKRSVGWCNSTLYMSSWVKRQFRKRSKAITVMNVQLESFANKIARTPTRVVYYIKSTRRFDFSCRTQLSRVVSFFTSLVKTPLQPKRVVFLVMDFGSLSLQLSSQLPEHFCS